MPKLYQPSNGSEGMGFMNVFCDRCMFDDGVSQYGEEKACTLLLSSLMYGTNDPEYPREWIYNEDGHGTCTKFILDGSKESKDEQIRIHHQRIEAAGQQRLFGD